MKVEGLSNARVRRHSCGGVEDKRDAHESIFNFSLPPNWRRERLTANYRITKKGRGFSSNPEQLLPFIPMELVPAGGKAECAYELREPSAIASGTYFEAGDILLSKITPSFENGKQGLTSELPGGFGYGSTEIIPLQTISSEATNLYLFYFLLHHEVRATLASKMEGSTGRQRVPEGAVRDLIVPLPPKPEQEKIAAVLWKVQQAIQTQDALLRATRDLKATAMQRLLSNGLCDGPIRETLYGSVPAAWDEQPLGACCRVQSGVTKGRKIEAGEAIEVPYLRVANVQDGHLDLREVKTITIRRSELNGYLLQEGDVLLTEGGDFDKLGRGFVWHGQVPNCIHQNHVFAVRVNRDLLTPEFLAYLIQSPYGKSYFLTVAHKTTNLASINSTKLKALPVLLPSVEEQRQIVAVLTAIDRKLAYHQKKRAVLNDLFQSLLHQLMTAQIRVANLDIDTNEVTDLILDADNTVGDKSLSAPSDHFVGADKMIGRTRRQRRV